MPAIVYDIGLNYDTKAADASLAGFRARVIAQLTELSSKQSKIELFKDLKGDSEKADQALQLIKKRSDELRAVLAKLGKDDVGFKQLTAEVKAVDKEFTAAARSANAVADRIKLLDLDLKKAGIDTSNLAAEQLALAAAFGKVQAASQVQTARGVLGVTGANEAQAQILKLTQAYGVLNAAEKAGTISSNELAIAKRNLNSEIAKVNSNLAGTSGTTTSVTTAFIALAAGAYAIGRGFTALTDAAKVYEQGIARIASISTLNKVQLAELGAEVVKLTAKIGVDLPTAFDALYNIISSGIPTENALTVLEQSAKAAIAGVTDVATASRVGVAVLNAYQLKVSELPRVFDVLFQTVQDGVITFEELSKQLGEILPVARSAGVGLEEVSAAIIVLTRNGLGAAEASTGIQRAIQALSSPTPEAVAGLLALGVAYDGLEGTLKQLADKNLGADVLRNIIPDVRGQRAVTILTQQYALFRDELELTTKSAGAAKFAFDKLSDTPEQQVKKLTAAFVGLTTAAGESLLPVFLLLVAKATDLINTFGELNTKYGVFIRLISGGTPGLSDLAAEFQATVAIAKRFGPELERMGISADKASFALEGIPIRANSLSAPLIVAGGSVGELGAKFLALDKAASSAAAVAVKSAGVFSEAFAPTASLVGKSLALVDAGIVGIEARLKFLADRLASVSGSSKTLFDQANTLTQQNLQLNITAIETLLAKREIGEFDAIRRIGEARQTSITTDLENLKTYSAQSIAVFDKEAADRRALAAKNGKDLVAFDIETRDAKLKLIGELQAKYTGYVLSIADQEKQLTKDIKAQQDERKGIVETSENAVRGIYRSGLNEFYQRVDIAREVEEKISKVRQAIASKDFEAAKQYATAANQLIVSSVNTLTEEEKKSATGIIVRSQAQQKLNEVTGLLTPVIDANIKSLEGLKTSYGTLKVEAVGAAVDISDKLATLRADQAQAIPLRVKEDSAQIDAEINNLQTKLAQRDGLLKVKLVTDEALAAAQKLVADIEKGKPQIEIDADFTKLKEKTAAALKALPSVDLVADDTKVLASFVDIEKKIVDLGKKRIDLQSNADAVSAKLAEINGLELKTKQLTIEVNYTYPNGQPAVGNASTTAATTGDGAGLASKFARGGLVAPSLGRQAIAQFAKGGFVGRVPGVGNTDNFLTYLQNGSFVLRKSAVESIGSGAADMPKMAYGGFVRPNLSPRTRFTGIGASGGTDYSLDGFIARVNDAPVFDRSSQMTAMFTKAQDLQNRSIAELRAKFPAGYIEANAEVFTRDKINRPRIEKVMAEYASASARQNSKSADSATGLAVEIANGMANPARGLTMDELTDLPQNQAAINAAVARMDQEAKEAAEKEKTKNGDKPLPPKKAAGGAIDGGMMAYTMPGEIVFGPTDVQRIGLSNLMAMNEATTREKAAQLRAFAIGGIVNAPPIHVPTFGEQWARSIGPTIDRFNAGGSVTNATNSNVTNQTYGPASVTINAASNVNERQLARMVSDELAQIQRRSR